MLNPDELLTVFAQVKEIGKRTGLLFREIPNSQRTNAAETLAVSVSKKEPINGHPTEQSIIDIFEDAEDIIHDARLRLFWRLCTLRVAHPTDVHINWEYKENITTLIAFKVKGEDLRIAGCSLYSTSDGLNKQGYPYLLPVRIGTLLAQKKVAEIDFLSCSKVDWKNLLLQTIIRCICTKNGLSNGTEMVLYSPVNETTPEEHKILTEIGFQMLPSSETTVYVLQDLHDLHIIQATPTSLRSLKSIKYCPADETSIFGPCE
jgi:hypothetical protein